MSQSRVDRATPGFAAGFSFAVLLFVAGCGRSDGRVHVQGLLKANGKPVGHAFLTFISPSVPEAAVGRVGPDGSFTLMGPRSLKKGAFPGDYVVRITRPILPDGRPAFAAEGSGPQPEPAYDSIPAKYWGPESTGLPVTIPPTGGSLTVELPEELVEK